MADDFVRIGQFEEFCRGNDQRFLDLEKKMDQGFAHASKEREHILVHLNLRFDAMEQRFDAMEKRFRRPVEGYGRCAGRHFGGGCWEPWLKRSSSRIDRSVTVFRAFCPVHFFAEWTGA